MIKVIRPRKDVVRYERENPDNPRGYKLTEQHQNPTVLIKALTYFKKTSRNHLPAIEFWFSSDFCTWIFLSDAERDQAFEEVYAAVSV